MKSNTRVPSVILVIALLAGYAASPGSAPPKAPRLGPAAAAIAEATSTPLPLPAAARAWPYRGITYASWRQGDYPGTTDWQVQDYPGTRAVVGVAVSTEKAHGGRGSLALSVALDGSDPQKCQGEALVDLRYHAPLADPPHCVTAPLNLQGVPLTAWLYAPAGSRGDPAHPTRLQVFAKDASWKSCYGPQTEVREETWVQIGLTPPLPGGDTGHVDPGFDATQVVMLGVRIAAGQGSGAIFSGTICLDDVDWPAGAHPKYGFEEPASALTGLAGTGASHVALVNTWYMDSPTARTISADPLRTHSEDEMARAIQEIHRLGLGVLLKPHIDVRDGSWRGRIAPTDRQAWCASYTQLLRAQAELAERTGAEVLCVGTELESMAGADCRACWEEVLRAVRGAYRGTVVYAANWDGYWKVSFWDRVDLVGIDAYFPLSQSRQPSPEELAAGWLPWVAQLEGWQRAIGKPIIFTEIGYASVDGCAAEPWQLADNGAPSCVCQAAAYLAATRALAGKPWFQGMFWWHWWPWPEAGGCCEPGFTPQHKAAEGLLAWLYGGAPGIYLPLVGRNYPRPTPSPTATRLPTLTPTPTLTSSPTPTATPRHDLVIYGDELASGWVSWSWDTYQLDLASTACGHDSARGIAVGLRPWGGLGLANPSGVSMAGYTSLQFYIRGSDPGGQVLRVSVNTCTADCEHPLGGIPLPGGPLAAGEWRRVEMPLADFGVAGQTLYKINIMDGSGSTQPAFCVDEILLR